ncbi:MAG: carbohydrate binding family 9 domain-containing protein [Balneolaceae bacterium]|nr:carbohydrate binding family 9 domain-containing protein [Balneolaceae bacterium]MBO6547824.1 carbohydrate binding family 9 domain-containing protein [Balneolaceae bacterium]MBO6648335.1 carbohydrate binding family 9 domain-containing protein [Balneolaceae bacterium]
MFKFLQVFIALLFFNFNAEAQNSAETTRTFISINPFEISQKVEIDGVLDEPFWNSINPISDFVNQFPEDIGIASSQTSIRIAYDEKNIYVGATIFDSSPDHIIRTLKRDFDDEYFGSDALAIVLDPVNRKSSGFFFGVNAAGSQLEGLLRDGGDFSTRLDVSWNTRWKSEVSQNGNTWFIEMAIPFEALNYEKDNLIWGINFVRNDMKNNSFSTMVQVPKNLNALDLGYLGELAWNEPPPVSGNKNVSLIPYVLGGVSQDFQNNTSRDRTSEIGLDAKIGVTSSLNLDLTANPDFSTVEVDRQVTDLSRFSIFFPERRNFFVENSDLFNSFGIGSINPFFSRRIGIENGNQVPILFGARLTGNATESLRIGAMSIQTSGEGTAYSQNYSVAAFQKSVLARSSIRTMFVNRQSVQDEDPSADFNRIAAIEFNYLSEDGEWGGELGFHKSFNPTNFDNEEYYKFSIRHGKRNYFTRFNAHKVGANYIADVGFIPRQINYDAVEDTTFRKGFHQFGYLFGYNFFPKNEKVNLHGPRFSSNLNIRDDGSFGSFFGGLFYYVELSNQNSLELSYVNEKDDLFVPSLIVGNLPFEARRYDFSSAGFWFRFDPRKSLSGRVQIRSGNFYHGTRTFLSSNINYRLQPWGNFGVSYTYNDIRFSQPYDDFQFHLVGPKTEIAFSRDLFWTTFIQYNSQAENLNINSRFQWRYSSLSDLYIVYTDNYNSESFAPKNRAVILKLNYWF